MGDSSYTRFSFPAGNLTHELREHLSTLFRIPLAALDQLLAMPPDLEPAGYDNGTTHCLVNGCPCLVLERDEWKDGGMAEETDLIAHRIPFLRINDATRDYGASQTVFDGVESIEVRLDGAGLPIVGASILSDGRVAVVAEELTDLQLCADMTRRVLAVSAATAA